MRRKMKAIVVTCAAALLFATPVAAQIPREEYLKYLPLSYPSLVRQTQATQQFQLYGDPLDPAYQDVSPRDGIDDRRAKWLHELGVRFAPLMVRNSALFPMDFRRLLSRPASAIHVDTWDLARDKASFVEHVEVGLTDLADRPCAAADQAGGNDCRLLDLVKAFGPGRGPVEPEVTGGAELSKFTVMYFDFPGYDEKTWKEAYWPKEGESKGQALAGTERVFVHPFIVETTVDDPGTHRYELVLQYWFFYPVNDGPNNHEGDWEHINVIVSPRSKVERSLDTGEMKALIDATRPLEGEDPLVIRRIEYYFHHFVYEMDFSMPNAYQPRDAWERQVVGMAKTERGGRWMFDRIRERAWQDASETSINTHPVVWIGGDAIGVQSVLEKPGLRDQDGHASYPFRGYYKHIGPGVGERVVREFDHRRYFEQPSAAPQYVENYGSPDKVVLLPDWERLTDPVLTDPAARREWAWFLLPVRFGFPATPSPGAGVISHMDTGNASVVGPAFNGGWNRAGAASGYGLYDAVKLSWATPLGTADSFFPRAGFLNAPILYFMLKPPLDLVWRTLALPVRAAVGTRQPTFLPANAPARRTVSLEVGAMVTPLSEDFAAVFLNRDQIVELALRLAIALPPDATDQTLTPKFPTVVAPVYSIVFHLSPRFSTESSLASYSTRMGFDVTASGLPEPVEVRGTFKQFDYQGNLRFNLLTGPFQPYVKFGTGVTWYDVTGVSVDGDPMLTPDSPTFRPEGNWWSLGFNETVLGGGVDLNRIQVKKVVLGLKANYTVVYHKLGFERQAGVEFSPALARELAGLTFSVWRHELRLLATVSF